MPSKSYAFMVQKLSNDIVKAMLSHCKVIAFTKKRVQKVVFSHPLSVFCPSFSPGLHFLPDMILIKQ